jgi:hypothetical protein
VPATVGRRGGTESLEDPDGALEAILRTAGEAGVVGVRVVLLLGVESLACGVV